jgi:hypothetical protein
MRMKNELWQLFLDTGAPEALLYLRRICLPLISSIIKNTSGVRKSGSMYLLVTVLPRLPALLLYSAYLSSIDMKRIPRCSNI